ncbi:MAG TPA: hypothetical protein VGQ10_08505, partial [Vicinamibacterales bacterium]|nr:hypothetical protein [Vicinamibacterales bacterium]
YDRSRNLTNLRVTLAPRAYNKEIGAALNGATRAVWLSPDYQGRHEVDVSWQEDKAEVTIPRLDVSGVVVVGPR